MNLLLNYEGFEQWLIAREVNDVLGGVQYIFRFENNYGASVVKHICSYGHEQDLWELAVILFDGEGDSDFNLCYDTPISEDVEGWLNDENVRNLLKEIKEL